MFEYLLVGLAVYVTASLGNQNSFKDANLISIIRGLVFGLLFWPVGLIIIYKANKPDPQNPQNRN